MKPVSLSPIHVSRSPKPEPRHRDIAQGCNTVRYLRLSPPSLSLQGQKPPNIQRDTRPSCVSEHRMRRARISELPMDPSSSDDDSSSISLYDAVYPRLRQEDGKDREINTMRISIVRKNNTVTGMQSFTGTYGQLYVFFSSLNRAISMDLTKNSKLTVQMSKSSVWLNRVLTSNGGAVSSYDAKKECVLLLTPSFQSQYMSSSARKFNHFPGCSLLYRSERLYETIKNLDIYLSFILPVFNTISENSALVRYKTAHPRSIWLSKSMNSHLSPQLLTNNQISHRESRLLVKYIRSPHLYDGRKYHLGFFILITSIAPLVVYIAKEGLVYLSKERFDIGSNHPDVHFLGEKDRSSWVEIRPWLNSTLGGVTSLLATATDIILELFLSLEPKLSSQTQRYSHQSLHNCFEIMEINIMFDRRLRPWFLGCKPLTWKANSALSKEVLEPVLCQALNIVGLEMSSNTRVSVGSPEQRALRRVEEETCRLRKSNSSLWERIFPTKAAGVRFPEAVQGSHPLNAYLCEGEAYGQ